MLKDKDAIRFEKRLRARVTIAEYEVWNLRQLLQSIRWVGKDDVILLARGLQETEHIAPYQRALLDAYLLKTLAYERRMVTVGLNADDT